MCFIVDDCDMKGYTTLNDLWISCVHVFEIMSLRGVDPPKIVSCNESSKKGG